jgi:hypothetical protein
MQANSDQFVPKDGEWIDGAWLVPSDDQADKPLIVHRWKTEEGGR